MAGIKISQLPLVLSAQLTDLLPVVQAGVTSGETLAQIQTLFAASPTGILPLINGGTGAALVANNGGIFYSTATTGAILAGIATANHVLMSGATAAPTWSVPTFPNTAGSAGQVLASNGTNIVFTTPTFPTTVGATGTIITSNGTNWIASTSLWPNTVGTALHILLSNGTNNVYSTPAYPNASVTAGKVIISDGTNYIASTSIFPNTVGAAGTIIRSDGTVNAYSTSTFADTYGINTILYNASANTVSGLATANDSVLVTSAGGVPSLSTTLPTGISATGMILTAAKIITSLNDTNNNEWIKVVATGSAVNEVSIANQSIGNSPSVSASGDDANIALVMNGKGTSGARLQGISSGGDVATGYVGEYVSSQVLIGSAVALTTGANVNITTISLSAGDWDVFGSIYTNPAAGTLTQSFNVAISIVSATLPTAPGNGGISTFGASVSAAQPCSDNCATRINVGATTTVYLVMNATFSVSTMSAYGFIGARRAC